LSYGPSGVAWAHFAPEGFLSSTSRL
jgi:hypothetical protein